MKQEDKELLLKDLCARLSYGIYANLPNHHLVSHKYIIHDINVQNGWTTGRLYCAGRIQIYGAKVEDVKPYLRPMSSMTEEELTQYKCMNDALDENYEVHIDNAYPAFDFLNSHHFDYRNLIEKGLAIKAPENMYLIELKE